MTCVRYSGMSSLLNEAERLTRDLFRFRSCEVIDVMRLRGRARSLARLVEIRGREHLQAALARGQGGHMLHRPLRFPPERLLLASCQRHPAHHHWDAGTGSTTLVCLPSSGYSGDLVFARRVLRHRQRPNIEHVAGTGPGRGAGRSHAPRQ